MLLDRLLVLLVLDRLRLYRLLRRILREIGIVGRIVLPLLRTTILLLLLLRVRVLSLSWLTAVSGWAAVVTRPKVWYRRHLWALFRRHGS